MEVPNEDVLSRNNLEVLFLVLCLVLLCLVLL